MDYVAETLPTRDQIKAWLLERPDLEDIIKGARIAVQQEKAQHAKEAKGKVIRGAVRGGLAALALAAASKGVVKGVEAYQSFQSPKLPIVSYKDLGQPMSPETQTPTATLTLAPAPPTSTPTQPPTVTPSPTEPPPTPTSTFTVTPTKEPTKEPTKTPEQQVGNMNIPEYLLGDLVNKFKAERIKRYDGSRVDSDLVNADTINLVVMGTDNTRDRLDEFQALERSGEMGRSDVLMMLSFNIHTQKTTLISLPRDLYAPEVGDRINAASGAPPNKVTELVRRTMEDATSMPVDGIVAFNIDFAKGGRAHDKVGELQGFIDQVFPEGLKIDVPYDIYDPEYPGKDYKYEVVSIKKGPQVLKGDMITKLVRSRHSTSDYGRNDLQRELYKTIASTLFPEIFKQLAMGRTDRLDQIIDALKKQQEYGNLKSDINITAMAEVAKGAILNMRNNPGATARLAQNSLDNFHPNTLMEGYGFTTSNGLVTIPGAAYITRPAESSPSSPPLVYWKPIRTKAKEMMVKANIK